MRRVCGHYQFVVSYNSCLLVCKVMDERNDRESADALEAMAQALQGSAKSGRRRVPWIRETSDK